MRFLFITCGILLLLGSLSPAQEPPLQTPPNRAQRVRVFQPRPAADPAPVPPTQAAPPTQAQQPLVRAQNPGAATPPGVGPAATAPLPEQLPPPTPPEVTYRNGQLTVQAMNSTLASLLTAIRNKTGIQFEGLEAGANDRVAVSMGPASEGEVLAAILGGSKYDYLVLDRPDSPGIVQRVLLTPHGGSATGATQAASLAGSHAQDDDEDVPDEQASGAEPEQPQDTPARPPLTQAQQQPQAQPPQTQQPATPKTPEQLLEELRRMQQQQQTGQNQTPNRPPPVPQ